MTASLPSTHRPPVSGTPIGPDTRERVLRDLINVLRLNQMCGDRACRRAGACAGATSRGLPPCFWRNRTYLRIGMVVTVELALAARGHFFDSVGSPAQMLLAKAACLGIDREAVDAAFGTLLERAQSLGAAAIPRDGRALGLKVLEIAVEAAEGRGGR
jgi:hypothetical protein